MPASQVEFLKGQELLADLPDIEAFSPLLTSGWQQTIAGQYWPLEHPRIRPKMLELDIDCGKLQMASYTPEKENPSGTMAILIHGLNGSYQSRYIQRMTHRFLTQGCPVLCVNLRNSGPGQGQCTLPYNAGVSEDIHTLLNWVPSTFPRKSYFVGGYSLGGNILLKALGEKDYRNLNLFAACISVPVDLVASTEKLSRKENRFFDRFFCYQTAKAYAANHHLSRKKPFRYSIRKRLMDFDDEITAGWAGYSSAREYYEGSSSLNVLDQISVPTLILAAKDDPVVDVSALLTLPESPHLDVVVTNHGGHVGFLDRNPSKRRWADELTLAWLDRRRHTA